MDSNVETSLRRAEREAAKLLAKIRRAMKSAGVTRTSGERWGLRPALFAAMPTKGSIDRKTLLKRMEAEGYSRNGTAVELARLRKEGKVANPSRGRWARTAKWAAESA